jgi:pSer/pThr/pTyr-binding forkhead associated (FHA) protein
MISRSTAKLRGSLNTISLQANSAPSLTIQETTHIPDSFYRAKVELAWPEWREIVASLQPGPLRDRLGAADGKTVQKELQRGILSDALARGETVTGVSLVKGHHVRLR